MENHADQAVPHFHVDGSPAGRIDPLGLDWIEYTGQTLTVWPGRFGDRGQAPLLLCKATSGYPGHQNARLDDEEFGPVRRGTYRIDLSLDPNRWAKVAPSGDNLLSAGGVQRIHPKYPVPNMPGYVYDMSQWGTWRARLDPVDAPTKRSGGFYIHNSTKGFTHGCIESCDGLYSRFVAYRDQGLKSIDVLVDYTTGNTNGGTKK